MWAGFKCIQISSIILPLAKLWVPLEITKFVLSHPLSISKPGPTKSWLSFLPAPESHDLPYSPSVPLNTADVFVSLSFGFFSSLIARGQSASCKLCLDKASKCVDGLGVRVKMDREVQSCSSTFAKHKWHHFYKKGIKITNITGCGGRHLLPQHSGVWRRRPWVWDQPQHIARLCLKFFKYHFPYVKDKKGISMCPD
jgi:hypothetical protein